MVGIHIARVMSVYDIRPEFGHVLFQPVDDLDGRHMIQLLVWEAVKGSEVAAGRDAPLACFVQTQWIGRAIGGLCRLTLGDNDDMDFIACKSVFDEGSTDTQCFIVSVSGDT